MTTETNWVYIERMFDAPIETVWDMWTKAELFAQWYGPNGMSVPVAEMDATLGGKRKICMAMETPERSMKMWFTGEYKCVEAPHKLVYTESMCDEAGNLMSPEQMGMPPGSPQFTEIHVTLAEEDGKTKMVMRHIGVPADSGGAGGWTQAIDKLAVLLEQV